MRDQAYKLDKMAIKAYGTSSKMLMAEAGRKISHFVCNNIRNIKTITIVAGKGNNGGDGFATALYLNNYDYHVTIFSIYDIHSLSKESLHFYNECRKNDI